MSFNLKSNYAQIAREAGFTLQETKRGHLDWRLIGSIELDTIIREQQFEKIDLILNHLSEVPLASMLESNILDSGISKYIFLTQLALQYLIFCRKFLDETVRTFHDSLAQANLENSRLKTINQEHSEEIYQLHKKISELEALNNVIFPCHICTKNFISNEALNIHLTKKHSSFSETQGKENDKTLIETIKLELEIKQLKERLNLAEKDIRNTVDSKKKSPRIICTCTQIKTNNDVGTQSNLCEMKERDCTEDKSSQKQVVNNECIENFHVYNLDVLSQLHEKVAKFEAWQENQQSSNQKSINEITQKLFEITECLKKSRSQHDIEIFTKIIKENILSNVSSKKMQQEINSEELDKLFSQKLTNILDENSAKIEEIVKKVQLFLEKKSFPIEKLALTAKSNENEDIIELHKESETKFLNTSEDENPLLQHNIGTYSVKSPETSEEKADSEEINSGKTFSSQQTCDKMDMKQQMSIKIRKQFEQEISAFGVHPGARNLSKTEAEKIFEQIVEKQNSLKKDFPRFYATRNKIKKYIELISTNKGTKTRHQSASISELMQINPPRQGLEYKQTSPESVEDLRNQIDMILKSPVKKPTFHTFPTKEPIPAPRKRVMFDNNE